MTTPAHRPDVVIAGAARCGTSSLAAALDAHPHIDAGAIKEPNYYSRELDRGADWYDSLYAARRPGLLRLDASTSYASPNHPEAIGRLAAEAPDALVLYVVRRPSERALSHYQFRHHHFTIETAPTFGAALAATDYYVEGGNYERWLQALLAHFPEERVLVVPFELVTSAPAAVTAVVCAELGVAAPPPEAAEHKQRNEVVSYRSDRVRRAAAALRRSRLYPRLRAALGADRVRQARSALTRRAELPSRAESLASCSAEQIAQLQALDTRSAAAVRAHLRRQDSRLGLDWADGSFASAVADR